LKPFIYAEMKAILLKMRGSIRISIKNTAAASDLQPARSAWKWARKLVWKGVLKLTKKE